MQWSEEELIRELNEAFDNKDLLDSLNLTPEVVVDSPGTIWVW